MSYKGKAPCLGCNKTGQESPRLKKDALCWDCQQTLKLGRAKQHEQGIEYIDVWQHYHALRDMNWSSSHPLHGQGSINSMIHSLLKAIDNPHVQHTKRVHSPFGDSFGSNGASYKIDSRLLEPLKAFIEYMNLAKETLDKLIDEQKKGEKYAIDKVIAEERDRIFNEGIEYGKNILLMLNSGELNMNDFAERISYAQHKREQSQ
jgi:hypothetical protein